MAIGRRLVVGLAVHGAFRSAAAVAFWFFLSLVPVLVLVGFLVVLVARRRGVDALVEPLLQIAPGAAEDLVRAEVERMAGSGASLAPLGVLGYLWTASSGLHNLLDVFDTAVRAKERPYWEKRAYAITWVGLGLAVTCLLAWLLVQVDAALRPLDVLGPVHPPPALAPSSGFHELGHALSHGHGAAAAARPVSHHAPRSVLEPFVGAVVTLGVGTGLLGCFYRFTVEHPAGKRRRVWPGTFAAVACWLAVSWAFGAYVTSTTNYALFYGSLAAVAVLLIWLYLTSLCLMVGVEVNAMLER